MPPPLCALLMFDSSLQSGSISGSSTCDRRRTSSGGRPREDHAGGLIHRQIARTLEREPRKGRRVGRRTTKTLASAGMARRQSEKFVDLRDGAVARPSSRSARGQRYTDSAATSARRRRATTTAIDRRPDPTDRDMARCTDAMQLRPPCTREMPSLDLPPMRRGMPQHSRLDPRIRCCTERRSSSAEQRRDASTRRISHRSRQHARHAARLLENVHPQIISSAQSGPHRSARHSARTSAPGAARSRNSVTHTHRHACPCKKRLTGPTRLAMSATANPAAPTRIAVGARTSNARIVDRQAAQATMTERAWHSGSNRRRARAAEREIANVPARPPAKLASITTQDSARSAATSAIERDGERQQHPGGRSQARSADTAAKANQPQQSRQSHQRVHEHALRTRSARPRCRDRETSMRAR